MKNFIWKLCTGNLHHECITDKEYLAERSEKLEKASSVYEQLEQSLSNAQKTLVKQLLDCESEIWADEVDIYFARGVKIGMSLQNALDKIEL